MKCDVAWAEVYAFDERQQKLCLRWVQVKVLAVSKGYAMVCHNGDMPFVVGVDRLTDVDPETPPGERQP
jgi:hypothetical protein